MNNEFETFLVPEHAGLRQTLSAPPTDVQVMGALSL